MSKWNRSSHCGTDHVTEQCVEVAHMSTGEVVVRSSRVPEVTVCFDAEEWDVFLAGVREGEFDRP